MDDLGLLADPEAMPGFADVRLTTVMGGFVLGWASGRFDSSDCRAASVIAGGQPFVNTKILR